MLGFIKTNPQEVKVNVKKECDFPPACINMRWTDFKAYDRSLPKPYCLLSLRIQEAFERGESYVIFQDYQSGGLNNNVIFTLNQAGYQITEFHKPSKSFLFISWGGFNKSRIPSIARRFEKLEGLEWNPFS